MMKKNHFSLFKENRLTDKMLIEIEAHSHFIIKNYTFEGILFLYKNLIK